MEEIINYLAQEKRDYQEGVALLGKYGRNRQLHLNLMKKENAMNTLKLLHELSKLAEITPNVLAEDVASLMLDAIVDQSNGAMQVPEMKVVPDVPAAPEPVPAPAVVLPINADAEYLAIVNQMTQLHNERVKLSNTLEDLETDEQRSEASHKINSIQESYNVLAVKKKHFDEFGKFPEAEPQDETPETDTKPVDLATLIKDRNNLRSRVSKAKKALIKKPGDVKKEEALAKMEVELNQLELQVKVATEANEREENNGPAVA